MFPRLLSLALIPPFTHLNKVRLAREKLPRATVASNVPFLISPVLQIRWELSLEAYRSQHEMLKNAVIITDTAFGIDYPRPLPPRIKMVGPLLPARLPQLSSSVSDWIRSSDTKIVFIHLGSMTYLEPWQVKEMLDGFSGEAFRVLVRTNQLLLAHQPAAVRTYLIVGCANSLAVGYE